MPQFLVQPDDVDPSTGTAVLRGEEARHLAQVLRARPGDPVTLFDGRHYRWEGVLSDVSNGTVRVRALHRVPANEPTLEVDLLQGLPKGDRWEWILEKGTELGIARFQPVYAEHGVARLSFARAADRLERWRRIAHAAAKQCERARVPHVEPVRELEDALALLGKPEPEEARLACIERTPPSDSGSSRPIRPSRVWLAVGPEGGWSASDRRLLAQACFSAQSLGPRILRTDTAGLAAVVLMQSWWGDLEPSPPA